MPIPLDILSSDGGRNLIGRRTQSDRTANAIRSGGGRNLIGRRTRSDRAAFGARWQNAANWAKKVAEVSGLRSTKSNTNCISALLVAAEAGDLRYFCWHTSTHH